MKYVIIVCVIVYSVFEVTDMIGVIDESRNREAFRQVAEDITRYIHFGAFDSIEEIVDSAYMPVNEMQKFFRNNADAVPDIPSAASDDVFRFNKINDSTFDVEYDFARGDKKAYMTMFLQFVYDKEEPYISVEIKDIHKN